MGNSTKKRSIVLAFVICTGISFSSFAAQQKSQSISQEDFYIGAGFSSNSVNTRGFDDATGYQIYAGYNLPLEFAGATHTVEVGYMDSGDFESSYLGINPVDPFGPLITYKVKENVTGLWGTYTFIYPLSDNVSVVARGGLDIGDDDGLMLGAGFEFSFDAPVKLRLELVDRSDTRSLQFNVVYAL